MIEVVLKVVNIALTGTFCYLAFLGSQRFWPAEYRNNPMAEIIGAILTVSGVVIIVILDHLV